MPVYYNPTKVEYSYIPWQMPALSSNGTMGGDTYACQASNEYSSAYPAWKTFDYNASTLWATVNNTDKKSITFYCPSLIKFNNIYFRNRSDQNNYAFTSGNIYGSADGNNWTLLTTFTNTVTNAGASWQVNIPNANKIKGHYIKVESTQAYVAESIMMINADKVVQKGTTNNMTSPIFLFPSNATTGFAQVKMTVTGEDNANINQITYPYQSTYSYIKNNAVVTFDLYQSGTITPILKGFSYTGYVVSGSRPGTTMKNVQYSVDGTKWTTITSSFGGRGAKNYTLSTPVKARYFRFTAAGDDGGYAYSGMYRLKIYYSIVPNWTNETYWNKLQDLFLGSTAIKSAYYGNTLVYKRKSIYLDSAKPGTYSLTLPAGKYHVVIVGGGGGGSSYLGGAGGYWEGTMTLTSKSTAVAVVGGGSAGGGAYCRNNGRLDSGGNSSLTISGTQNLVLTAPGGQGGIGRRHGSTAGTSYVANRSGNVSTSMSKMSETKITEVSWYNGYGAGGETCTCDECAGFAGGDGYVLVERI